MGLIIFPIYFSCSTREYIGYFLSGVLFMVSKKLQDKTVCVVGLGYVGLSLVQDFSE